MTAHEFTLVSKQLDDPILRTISIADLELLREWKNENRDSFFFRGTIGPEDQIRWFEGYTARENDWMFLILASGKPIGCMGFRLLDGQVDIYNVILGRSEFGKRGLMRSALRLMCSYCIAQTSASVTAKVIRDNPAIAWYEKSGFRRYAEHDDYIDLELDLSQFSPCEFESRL